MAAQVGSGNVEVVIDGKDFVLVPTAGAAQGISRAYGGLRGAINLVSALDLDAITRVIQLGLGPKAVKELGGNDKLGDLVWRSGLSDNTSQMVVKCIEYITVLTNGGRPVTPAGEEDEETGKDPQ